jgi:cytochrome P450
MYADQFPLHKVSSFIIYLCYIDHSTHFASQVDIPNRVRRAKVQFDGGIRKERETLYDALFDSNLPAEEKSVYRLTGEGAALLGAGTETASWALSVITFYLLTKSHILNQLTQELQVAVEDPRQLPSWYSLEQLPYLRAVILEGLRLSYGVSARTPRVPVDEDLVYHGL